MRVIQYAIGDFTHNLRGNVFGGVTAAVVALPLALAFGISSGIGPVAGLYGAIVTGLFAAIFGGTRPQITGPTGPMTVVVTAMTADFMARFPEQGLSLVFTTVVLGGVLQSLIGFLRLGRFIIQVPYPVISGFMTGIGVIIIALQIGPFLGFVASGSVIAAFAAMPTQILSADIASLVAGGGCLCLLFIWRGRVAQLVPPPLLVLIIATLAVLWIEPFGALTVIGSIPSSLPSLQIPEFNPTVMQDMVVNALMLAVLGSIDSLLTSLVADNMSGKIHDAERELIGQGIGNCLSGLIGGLPGAGATMRTVVNIRAGGDGPLSGVVHAVVLFSAVIGLGFLFEKIPLAALSAVLIKVGIDIVDWPFLLRIKQLPRFTVVLMLLVLGLTVFVDLITAVFVGVFIKNLMLVDQLSSLELGNLELSDGSKDSSIISEPERVALSRFGGHVLLFKMTGPLSYAVSRQLSAMFNTMTHPRVLMIDMSRAKMIGVTTTLAIETLIKTAQVSGSRVILIDHKFALRGEYRQLGMPAMVGLENCFSTFSEAVDSINPALICNANIEAPDKAKTA